MNRHTLRVLEYDKVLAQLATYASFGPGKTRMLSLRPTTFLDEAQQWLQETEEARQLLIQQPELHLGGVHDLEPILRQAALGGILSPHEFLQVRSTVLRARRLRQLLLGNASTAPTLADFGDRLPDLEPLAAAIGRVISERGEVLDSASQRLARLRALVHRLQDRVTERIQRIARNPDNAPYLQETIVTQRQGRYVLPVRAEFKGKIPGIVHDQSGSGATLFVEPFSVVDLNNTLRQHQAEAEEELLRILRELSALVADDAPYLHLMLDILADLDVILARARYADALDANAPQLRPFQRDEHFRPQQHPGVILELRQARHPLLAPESVVPIDFHFSHDTFIVVMTGPNTGGKTVSLKTAGLLALMAQSGMPIPAAPGSQLTLFQHIFADIGDEQSIEQNLSTFSSHMNTIVDILAQATPHSLVLLDELGSGTDPEEGSALARALLQHLRDAGIPTVATTHYSEVKLFAHSTAGITNASVEFDPETLSPTYELTIGLPGRSNALAIARRWGMPDTIIQQAEQVIHPESLSADTLLDEIREARNQARQARKRAELHERMVEAQTAALREQLASIEEARRAVLNEAREQAQAELEALRNDIRKLRNQMGKGSSQHSRFVQEAEKAIRARKEAEKRLSESVTPEPERISGPPQPGDLVWVESLFSSGEVEDVWDEEHEAEVRVGSFRIKLPFDHFEITARPRPQPAGPRRAARTTASNSPGMELDMRGMRVEEGLEALDSYIDAAYLAELPWVRLIHGKGTGVLRKVVHDFLRRHPVIASYRLGEAGEGGDGVTIAKFKL
jgi:DNA mismatch repair protein MutS2